MRLPANRKGRPVPPGAAWDSRRWGRKALHLDVLNTDSPKACNTSNHRNVLSRDGMQQGVRRHASLHPSDKGLATNEASATGRTVVRNNLQVDNTMVVTSRVLSTKQPACTAKSSVLPVPLQTATRTPSTQITIVLVTAKPQHFSFLPHTHQARKSTELPVGLATFTPPPRSNTAMCDGGRPRQHAQTCSCIPAPDSLHTAGRQALRAQDCKCSASSPGVLFIGP